MPYVARINDPTSHGGTLQGTGVPSVRIAGQAVAVVGDPRTLHQCPIKLPPPPHPNAPLLPRKRSVSMAGASPACVGDPTACGAQVASGAGNVSIGR